jgi:hypothetical protein
VVAAPLSLALPPVLYVWVYTDTVVAKKKKAPPPRKREEEGGEGSHDVQLGLSWRAVACECWLITPTIYSL